MGAVGVPAGGRVRALPGAVALTLGGWAVGLSVTAAILGTPYLVFGYPNAGLHLVLDTADAFIALLVAYLVLGRFLRRRRLQDLLLVEGLLCLAVAGLGLSLLFDVFGVSQQSPWEVWWSLAIRIVGTALIAASALAGDRPAAGRLTGVCVWGLVALLLTALALLVVGQASLPPALDSTPPASAQRPVITGHPALIASQGLMAVLFLVASVAYTRQAARTHDALLRWVGPAFALGACARVNYLLFPSLYTDWIYTGDVLRTGTYLLLLVGAAREIGQYWATRSAEAVLEDRRRLARELHDGVIQELGYIRSEAHALDPDRAEEIVRAADRALDEARAAVDALGRATDEPLSFTLHRAARQVAERYDAQLEVDLDDSVTVTQDQRHALVRIAREAISNAIRHGHATKVRLRLVRDPGGCRLVVEDDGRGFEAHAVIGRGTGYGLMSMRDRARGLSGTFDITSHQGKGTVVTVTW